MGTPLLPDPPPGPILTEPETDHKTHDLMIQIAVPRLRIKPPLDTVGPSEPETDGGMCEHRLMTVDEIDAWLTRSLDDSRLSRNERQALALSSASQGVKPDLEAVRHRAFELARARLEQPTDRAVLDWLEDVIKVIRQSPSPVRQTVAEAYFSPGTDCPQAIERLLARTRKTADICVFTITDDRLADALLAAHARGVAVRIITDNDKAEDLGSDVGSLRTSRHPGPYRSQPLSHAPQIRDPRRRDPAHGQLQLDPRGRPRQ